MKIEQVQKILYTVSNQIIYIMNKNNTKNITIRLSNSQYEKLQNYCDSNNIARATFIKSRISDIID